MRTEPTDNLDHLRAIADSLDCMLDEDLQALGDVKPTTTEAWRKRGKGPPYLIFGNRALYPKKPAAAYLQTLIRERTQQTLGKDAL